MFIFSINKDELKSRHHYLGLLLLSTYFVYFNSFFYNNELFNLAMTVVALRIFSKKYFEIKQPWKYYLFLAVILAFYIKANSDNIDNEKFIFMLFAN